MKMRGQEADPQDVVKPIHAFGLSAAAFGLSALLKNERYSVTAKAVGIAIAMGGTALALIKHSQRASEDAHAKELAHLPKTS